jgi:ATP-dependent helicase HepA
VLDRGLIRVAVTVRPGGLPGVESRLFEVLATEVGKSLQGDQIRAAFPDLASFVEPGVAEATRAATGQLKAMQTEARKKLDEERDRALIRLERALRHQGMEPATMRAQLDEERAHHRTLVEALEGVRLQLDSVCAFVLAR